MDDKIIKVYVVGGDNSYTRLFIDKIRIVKEIKDADIVLFTGGEDVHPGYYGENVGQFTHTNKRRDEMELSLFNEARRSGKLCLGICRGAQALTVFSGGELIQHVTNHAIGGSHKIHLVNEDVDIDITSTHHQMMWPFYLDKEDYSILAKSTADLSTTYLNGDDNERRLPSNFVEPEIAYYKRTNCLCIQGHPEYMPKDSSAVRYINVLVREYLEDTVDIKMNDEGELNGQIAGRVINAPNRVQPINWNDMIIAEIERGGLYRAPRRKAMFEDHGVLDLADPNDLV